MPDRSAQSARKTPDFEVIFTEPGRSFRWRQHDYPSDLERWNYHPDYELHLITRSSGTMFMGDAIEDFFPENLCLIGPNILHHWNSNSASSEAHPGRDVMIQFSKASLEPSGTDRVSELAEIDPC